LDRVYKILICDDSPTIQLAIQEMLKSDSAEKYETILANNGREACILANRFRPDLILMDIEMPEMDGIEAIRKIKSFDKLQTIPIVVLSGSRSFQKAMKFGANDFLLKPVDQYELLLRIQLNIELALKTVEIKRQHDLLIEQKQEVINQRDTIMQHQRDLLDDLNYASYIQKAIFPDNVLFEELCSSYFIYNKPKNIVSGDFYWVSRKNDLFVFAVGDCTGHGISGALMTIAGNAFLNDIVNNYNQDEADKILNDLRIRVIKLLHQKGNIGEASNGMDIALCVYDKNTGTLKFSGANNPLYIIRSNNTFDIIKADKMPIGIHINYEKPFAVNELTIAKGDTIYMFSDGFADQFGGDDGVKFRYKQFQELLFNCSSMPMIEQVQMIEYTMTKWMGSYEQVDDMLILGLKF
jgi:phosphoserine phosphatase RsbU/P